MMKITNPVSFGGFLGIVEFYLGLVNWNLRF